MSEERRLRKRVDFPAQLKALVDEVWVEGELINISMSGALVKLNTKMNEGEEFRIKINQAIGNEFFSVEAGVKVVRFIESKDSKLVAVVISEIDTESSINLFNIVKYQGAEIPI